MAKQPAKKPATKKPAKTPAAEWVELLRTGPAGVKKWNKLKVSERAKIDLSGTDLSGCDLSGIDTAGTTAAGASFATSTLTAAKLRGAFNKASFAGANLERATLTGCAFDETDFTGAKLAGANLTGSHFRGATFAGADLTGANLTDISLTWGADVSTATLTGATWGGGFFDKETKWPPGFAIPGEWLFHGKGTDPRLVGKGKKAVAADINGLMARLHATIDEKRMKRTLDMLKSGKNQLFAEVEPTMVRGIVRSQRDEDTVYSCVLCEDGTYTCSTPDVSECMGLRGEPCKHILVLLIGLAHAGKIDPPTADKWVVAARGKNHKWNKTVKNHVSDTLLKYKGAQAGEIDWRPTETLPEDFYAM